MKKFHHFGDSYATLGVNEVKHFCEIIANTYEYQYIPLGMSGYSNEQILNILINKINTFNKGDVLFFNFSFFTRGCWFDKKNKTYNATNFLYDDINKRKIITSFEEKEKVLTLINYYVDYTEDYARKIFRIYNSLFQYIQSLGVDIFYIFVDDSEYADDLLKIGLNIKFENGFCKWLHNYNFHNNEEGHYSRGIQQMLADVIIRKTNNIKPNSGEIVFITIKDIDQNKIIKNSRLI